jgi:hypothetical protein
MNKYVVVYWHAGEVDFYSEEGSLKKVLANVANEWNFDQFAINEQLSVYRIKDGNKVDFSVEVNVEVNLD